MSQTFRTIIRRITYRSATGYPLWKHSRVQENGERVEAGWVSEHFDGSFVTYYRVV